MVRTIQCNSECFVERIVDKVFYTLNRFYFINIFKWNQNIQHHILSRCFQRHRLADINGCFVNKQIFEYRFKVFSEVFVGNFSDCIIGFQLSFSVDHLHVNLFLLGFAFSIEWHQVFYIIFSRSREIEFCQWSKNSCFYFIILNLSTY